MTELPRDDALLCGAMDMLQISLEETREMRVTSGCPYYLIGDLLVIFGAVDKSSRTATLAP